MRTFSLLPLLLLAVACSGKVSIGANESTQGLKKNPDGSPTGDGQTCTYGGQTVKVGESFPAPDGCNTCSCTAQGAACTEMACVSDGGSLGTCDYQGHTYHQGESFPSGDGCNTCSCAGSALGGLDNVVCTQRACAPKDCSLPNACAGQPMPGMPNWQCFDGSTGGPVCSDTGNGTCGYAIRECSCQGAPTHKPGDSWQEACNSCSCQQDGLVACTATACSCPPDGTIDCQPVVPPSSQAVCSGSYHQWVVANCPNVKFVY